MEEFKKFLSSISECYLFGAGVVGYYTVKWMTAHTSVIIKKILVTLKDGNVDYYGGISVRPIDELQESDKETVIVIATLETLHGQIQQELQIRGFRNIYALPEYIYRQIRNTDLEMGMEWYHNFCRELKKLDIKNYKNNSIQQFYFYSTGLDESLYLKQWIKMCSDNHFFTKLLALVHGLDDADVEEIYRIVHRLNLLKEKKPILQSKKERYILDKREKKFLNKIFMIGPKRFIYKNYVLPISHFGESVFWYEHGIKQFRNPNYLLEKDVIDAGAFIGDSAIVISKHIKGNSYSFETEQENYEILKRTLEMNNLKNVISVNSALSDHTGILNLYKEKTAGFIQSNNSVMDENSLRIPIKKADVCWTTIDEYVNEHRLKMGLIKTDVEGCEKNLLEGAIRTIKEQKPDIMISTYHNLDDFFEIEPWLDSLLLGYSFKVFRSVIKNSFMTETMLICEAKDEA